MELQEAVLKAVISEIRFKPTPRFPEARAELIERLRDAEGLDNWAMSEQFVQVFTEGDPRTLLQVSIGHLSTSFENMAPDECRAATGRTIETALDALGLEAATYIGVRSLWLAATDDFDQLHEWLIEKIGGAAPSVLEPVGQKPSDSGWVFEFRSSEPEHLLRVGPMRQEQATSQLFRDKEPENYPPQFLYIDLAGCREIPLCISQLIGLLIFFGSSVQPSAWLAACRDSSSSSASSWRSRWAFSNQGW